MRFSFPSNGTRALKRAAMERFSGIHHLTGSLRHPVVAIGNFDGVHLGHQEILRQAIEKARASGGTSVVYTFRPHPGVALRPETAPALITTYEERAELLERFGLDVLIEEPFSREFSNTAGEEFLTDVLIRKLNARAIVVGYDFAFGRERQVHLKALEELARKLDVDLTVVQPVRIDDEVVSSTRIRQHLFQGDVERASEMMGHAFAYRGVVVKGEGRGRKLGFPTANLLMQPKLVLPKGVYATDSLVGDQTYSSVTNVGFRPTFQISGQKPGDEPSEQPLIETHLIRQSIDLYGSCLEVRFRKRLRAERRFANTTELIEQIRKDVQDALP